MARKFLPCLARIGPSIVLNACIIIKKFMQWPIISKFTAEEGTEETSAPDGAYIKPHSEKYMKQDKVVNLSQ